MEFSTKPGAHRELPDGFQPIVGKRPRDFHAEEQSRQARDKRAWIAAAWPVAAGDVDGVEIQMGQRSIALDRRIASTIGGKDRRRLEIEAGQGCALS